ncbi:putative bifunctional diguanylate cyclase/phosphodiesterase [Oricola cellulosilytica]|nr:bifunctional diguanylate cyclase/phosphodiesterase [Oricola cellulosilytica]
MTIGSKTDRSAVFRLVTIFSSGFGAATLSLWALTLTQAGTLNVLDVNATTAIIAGLAALAGAGCAHAFFIGSDEATKAYEEALETDPLTGLLSRIGLERRIAELSSKEGNGPRKFDRLVLVSVEIDALRDINDAHGQEFGDRVLQTIGERLRRMVGTLGPVARIGGSEFTLAVRVNRDNRELPQMMAAITDEIARPIASTSGNVPIFSVSGLAEVNPGEPEIKKLLQRTRLARATARASGLGSWAIYHPEMAETDRYRKWIETELGQAIGKNEFELVYQPQVDTTNGETVGYEALLRWEHREKGAIPPAEFITVAEKCGLINQIGSWVLRQACVDARYFTSGEKIAVNVSPKQMEQDDFVDTLAAILRAQAVDPARIEIEITENVLIHDQRKIREQFEQIRALGCSIAIDDFGTGYSNLNYLSDLPFSKLKLDQSFVSRIEDRKNGGALVSTIVNLARALDVDVLAEGVETENQMVMLNAAGCTLMQGYYFGKPVALQRQQTLAA